MFTGLLRHPLGWQRITHTPDGSGSRAGRSDLKVGGSEEADLFTRLLMALVSGFETGGGIIVCFFCIRLSAFDIPILSALVIQDHSLLQHCRSRWQSPSQ